MVTDRICGDQYPDSSVHGTDHCRLHTDMIQYPAHLIILNFEFRRVWVDQPMRYNLEFIKLRQIIFAWPLFRWKPVHFEGGMSVERPDGPAPE
jgi:hypothetical protein